MARTTGPVLALGAIAIGNQVVLNSRPMNWKIPVGVGIAAGAFALAEHVWADGAVALAWLALVAVLLARIDPNVPSPVESLNTWWKR